MARQVEDILKQQLGSLLVEIAILQSKLEATQEKLDEKEKGSSNG